MLHKAGLADTLWGEAVHTAVYLKNRSLTSALETAIIPLVVFTGGKPDLVNLIPYGAKGFRYVPKEVRSKGEPISIPCTLIGYGKQTNNEY